MLRRNFNIDDFSQAYDNYTYGHDLLAQHNPTYGPAYYHYDAQLSTRFLTDLTGTITNTYEYSATGSFLTRNDPFANPFTYTGEYFDPESSLLYLRARYLDIVRSRFLSRDMFPFQFRAPQSINRYVYCLNNGVNCIDLSGNQSVSSMNAANAIALSILIPAISLMQASFMAATFGLLPDNPYHGLPDVGILGVQGSINAGASLGKLSFIAPFVASVLSTVSGVGGVEVLLPKWPLSIWLYGYAGIGINMLGIMDYVDLDFGVDVTGYAGLAWDVKETDDYEKSFFCTGLGLLFGLKRKIIGILSRFGKIGPGITICAGLPNKETHRSAHGFYVGMGIMGNSAFQSPLAVSSSWNVYNLFFKLERGDRPQPPMNIEGLMMNWWWLLDIIR